MNTEATAAFSRYDAMRWGVIALLILLVFQLKLIPALFTGLLVHELVFLLASVMGARALGQRGAKLAAVVLISIGMVAALSVLAIGVFDFLRKGDEGLPVLFAKLAQIIDDSRHQIPAWILQYIPSDAETLRATTVEWLRNHPGLLSVAGRDALIIFAQTLIAMITGFLIALRPEAQPDRLRPFTRWVHDTGSRMTRCFRNVVFAQIWISAINAFLTGVFLLGVLPLFDVQMPLAKTLVLITFITGLIPIIGNIISNTITTLVGLSVSLPVAVAALGYLVFIHQLEYFLNARIIGSHIRAKAWELLLVMLALEAAFGIPGLVAAPVFYAYYKDELAEKQLI